MTFAVVARGLHDLCGLCCFLGISDVIYGISDVIYGFKLQKQLEYKLMAQVEYHFEGITK